MNPPHISQELLDYLDTLFPNQCARPGLPLDRIWMETGARQVVEHLKGIYQEQMQRALSVQSNV